MEPDDLPVHDLLGVGDGVEPGPDDLRAIVARAGRRRWRFAAAGVAAALAVGGVSGYALSNHSSPSSQTADSPAAAPSGSNADTLAPLASGSAVSGGGYFSATGVSSTPGRAFTHLFTRTAGAVTIRGYLTNFPQPVASVCLPGAPLFQAELSTAQMVGTVDGAGASPAARSVSSPSSFLIGTAEGDPVAVVVAVAGSGVTSVRMSFTGGATDAMTPVKGWVALAAPVSSKLPPGGSLGTLTTLGAGGAVLGSTKVTFGSEGSAVACGPPGVLKVCPAALRTQQGSVSSAAGGTASSSNTSVACANCPSTSRPPASSGSRSSSAKSTTSTTVVVNPGGPMLPCPFIPLQRSGLPPATVAGGTGSAG
jgi:hypothetical protein